MKTFTCMAMLLLGAGAATAQAQYVVPTVTYYAPAAPVVVPAAYTPVVVARRPYRAYYAPAPGPVNQVYYSPVPAVAPVTTMYAPSVYAPGTYVAPVYPYVAARPVVLGRSVYGTRQVYVPGQPVRNTWRAVTP